MKKGYINLERVPSSSFGSWILATYAHSEYKHRKLFSSCRPFHGLVQRSSSGLVPVCLNFTDERPSTTYGVTHLHHLFW